MQLVRYGILAVALGGFSGYGLADDNVVSIGGGPKTGAYIGIAQSVCDSLGQLFTCKALETKGTTDNKKRLEAHEIQFGLAKANIAAEWLKEPAFGANYTVVKRIGDESLFVFGTAKNIEALGSWTGVRDNAFLLSVGLPGALSGDAAVFTALKSVPNSPLSNIEVKMYDDRPALVEAVRSGAVKLGFITQVPDPNNELFKEIDKAGLKFMGVIDPDMLVFGDTFRIKPVTVKNAKWLGLGGKATQIETANVPVAIVAVKPETLQGRAAMVQKAAIDKIEKAPEAELLPKQGWMQALANTATIKAGAGLEKMLKSMEEAAKGAKERLESK